VTGQGTQVRDAEFEQGSSQNRAIMTEPENFEEDLFADLYVARIAANYLSSSNRAV
jgi:hypothetical protein